MPTTVRPASPAEILPLQRLHRAELNAQFILDSWLARGWTDNYLLFLDDQIAGYALTGGGKLPRTLITEFFLHPHLRAHALPLFRQFITASNATSIETQSNDLLLTLLLYDTCTKIEAPVILFHDALTTHLQPPGVTFRPSTPADIPLLKAAGLDPEASHLLETDGRIAAAGGVLFHYNPPFGDIYMAVAEPFRRRGLGSFLVQELKRITRDSHRLPAARCNAKNPASRATLQKAGLLPCARVLTGKLA
jgi:GNAT superfamily N-acetyltransferase